MESDPKLPVLLKVMAVWFMLCVVSAIGFGFEISTALIWATAPFLFGWEIWYLYYTPDDE